MAEPNPADPTGKNAIRCLIFTHLALLSENIEDRCALTTHVSMCVSPRMDEVLRSLANAFTEPSSYNLSEFVQRFRRFTQESAQSGGK